MQPNPYEAPKQPEGAPQGSAGRTADGWLHCPACRSENVARVGFTWWGGALGPRVLSHVKCHDCGHTYNGRHGQSNNTGIIMYSIIIGLIAVVLVYAFNM